jgi:thiamine biosynthesis lipoprotein
VHTYNVKSYMIQSARLGLGTIIKITIDHPNASEGHNILEFAFQAIDRIENLMSVYKTTSEIAVLNRNGFKKNVSLDTQEVLKKAKYYFKITNGVFDVTVSPVLKLRERLSQSKKIMKDIELRKASRVRSSEDIIIENGKVSLKKGMSINLGGIAKGYAVDVAADILSGNGVGRALVDAGGDIRVIGTRADGSPWKIGLGDPKSARRVTSSIGIADFAVATSGTYRRGISDIIDARSGRTAKRVIRSTVVAEKAVDADALATSTYILGADKGMELIESIDGVGALILTKEGELIQSSRWESLAGLSEGEMMSHRPVPEQAPVQNHKD